MVSYKLGMKKVIKWWVDDFFPININGLFCWVLIGKLKLQTDLFYHSFTEVYGYFLFSIWDSLQKNISKAFKSSNLPSHFCLMHAYCLSSHVFVRHYWLLISPFFVFNSFFLELHYNSRIKSNAMSVIFHRSDHITVLEHRYLNNIVCPSQLMWPHL